MGGIGLQVHLEQSAADAELLLNLRTGAVEVQTKFTKGLDATDARQTEHGRGIHGQRKAFGLEHHEHTALAHTSLHVGTQVDLGTHLRARQHQFTVFLEQLEITATSQQRRAVGRRAWAAKGQIQRSRGFQNAASFAELEQFLTAHHDGCFTLALAIAVDVALAEIHRAAFKRPLTEAGGVGQTHAASVGREAGHALERECIGLGLQTHKGAAALGVLQQHDSHRAAVELNAHEALIIALVCIQACSNVDTLGCDGGQRHGSPLAVVQVNRAPTRSTEGKCAGHAEHATDLKRGIGHQRHKITCRCTVVQCHRGALPARGHADGACTGQVHDLRIGSAVFGAQRQIGLH